MMVAESVMLLKLKVGVLFTRGTTFNKCGFAVGNGGYDRQTVEDRNLWSECIARHGVGC
jgi:hypothetical protein